MVIERMVVPVCPILKYPHIGSQSSHVSRVWVGKVQVRVEAVPT